MSVGHQRTQPSMGFSKWHETVSHVIFCVAVPFPASFTRVQFLVPLIRMFGFMPIPPCSGYYSFLFVVE